MIPQYVFRALEEIARGVAVAVVAYAAAAIVDGGVPASREAALALLTGALPVAYAALRAALNKTVLTPDE